MIPNRSRSISRPSPLRRHEHVIIIGMCRLPIRKPEASNPFCECCETRSRDDGAGNGGQRTQRKQIPICSNIIHINFLSITLLLTVIPILVEFESDALVALVTVGIRLVNLRILW